MEELFPAFKVNNNVICFIVKDFWSKYLSVAIQSLVDNCSSEQNYDIIVISNDMQLFNRERILNYNSENISVRILQINDYIKKYDLSQFCTQHTWGIEMYYRVFLPEILKNFSKVLYLDADIVIVDDIAKLYNTELGDNEIGVCRTLRQLMEYHKDKQNAYFFSKILKLENMHDYFNSGVLLMNLELMRKSNMINRFINILNSLPYVQCPDQDVFNVLYKDGKKMFFDMRWNHIYFACTTIEKHMHLYEKSNFEQYKNAQMNPGIIHFAGELKPWFEPWYQHGPIFWSYARKTSFYEEIMISTVKKYSEQSVHASQYEKLQKEAFKYKLKALLSFGNKRRKYILKRKFTKSKIYELRKNFPCLNS